MAAGVLRTSTLINESCNYFREIKKHHPLKKLFLAVKHSNFHRKVFLRNKYF